MGVKTLWPGDRITSNELSVIHVSSRVDSVAAGARLSLDSTRRDLNGVRSDQNDLYALKCVEIRTSKDPQYLVTHNLFHMAQRCRELLDGAP